MSAAAQTLDTCGRDVEVPAAQEIRIASNRVGEAAQDSLVARMESKGFETLHRSAGYSNHRHREPGHGRVDFMYVRGETAERVFAGVRQLPGPGGLVIAVPRPEHLIAMKVRGYFERAGLGGLDLPRSAA